MKIFMRLRILFSSDFDKKYRKLLAEGDKERKNLDERLSKVARATLDGEDQWFLDLVKDDPECVLNVIKECGKDDR